MFGHFSTLSNKGLSSLETGNRAIFTCPRFSFALIWGKSPIYVFEPHSCDSKDAYFPNGHAILLEFKSLKVLNAYVINHYEKNFVNMLALQYNIQYIKIESSECSLNPKKAWGGVCFSENVISRKEIKSGISVAFNIIINYIFPKKIH